MVSAQHDGFHSHSRLISCNYLLDNSPISCLYTYRETCHTRHHPFIKRLATIFSLFYSNHYTDNKAHML